MTRESQPEQRGFSKSRVFRGMFVRMETPAHPMCYGAALHTVYYPVCPIEAAVLEFSRHFPEISLIKDGEEWRYLISIG